MDLITRGVVLDMELVGGARAGSLGSPFEELSFVSEHFEIGLRNILGWADAEASDIVKQGLVSDVMR